MRRLKDERGQVLVLVALSMTVLIGFVGFATDVGMLLRERRIAQSVADGAAIGAATEALNERNWTTINSNIYNSAVLDASMNGYTTNAGNGAKDSSSGVTLTVYAGSNITIPGYQSAGNFQAVVIKSRPTIFMYTFGKLFGSDFSNIDVAATAIASNMIPSNGCGHFNNGNNYDPAGSMGGSSRIFANDCGITVNGNLDMGGNSNITAKYLIATGDISNTGSSGITGQEGENQGGSFSDPWQSLKNALPTLNGTTCTAPGGMLCVYDFGCTKAKGCVANNCGTTCALSSGPLAPNTLYYYDKSVDISGNVSSPTSGGGNTIYLAGTTPYLDFASVGNLTLIPPGTDCPSPNPLCGVLIDAPFDGSNNVAPNSCSHGKGNNYGNNGEIYFDFGSSNTILKGDIYAPYMQMFVQDQGANTKLYNDFVIGTFCSQAATLYVNGFSGPQSPNTRVGLVY